MFRSFQFCHPDRNRSSQSDDLWSGGTWCCEVNWAGWPTLMRHPAEAAPPFAVFEGWELGISGAKLLQKDRSIRVQGNEIIYLTLGPWTKPVQILVKPPAHLVFG